MAFEFKESFDVTLLSSISHDLLKEVFSEAENTITEKGLLALHAVFGGTLERALELLEKDCVTILSDPRGYRTLVQVAGTVGTLYTLYPQVNFCPCPAYRYHVVGTRTNVTCKHVLAAHLATTWGRCSQRQITGIQLSELLLKNSSLGSSELSCQ